jgi:hypothetical protein
MVFSGVGGAWHPIVRVNALLTSNTPVKIAVRCFSAIARWRHPPKNQHVACLAVQTGSGGALEAGIMNSRRFATLAALLCQTILLAGWVVAWLAGFGSAAIERTGTAPMANRPPLAAEAEPANTPQRVTQDIAAAGDSAGSSAAVGDAALRSADVAMAAAPETVMAGESSAPSEKPTSIIEAQNSSQMLPPETTPVQVATASTSDPPPGDAGDTPSIIGNLEDCPAADACIDRYLWALYQRTPKEDTIKVYERRKVSVRRKGKTVTVTRTFTRLVDEDFTWKDPKAAERSRMPMMDYVIGGMDRTFRLKLFHTLRAAEVAGLSPGITSAFRDDYRQSIASGLKAASDRSYHGGSSRGGYGHGLAADVVSVKGGTRDERWNSSETLWKWIDAHGKEFGIGRPYSDRDPPHLAPIDGKEYASHHHETKVHHARSDLKKRNRLAVRDDRSAGPRHKASKSPRVRII